MTERLRAVLKGTQRVLASNVLATAAIASAMAALLVWVLPFILYGIPEQRVQAILYDEPFGRVILATLALTTIFCTLPRFARLTRRTLRVPDPDQRLTPPGEALRAAVPFEVEAACDALTATGFQHVVHGDGWCWGVRRRWALLGSLVFHIALLVIAVGALYAVLAPGRFSGNLLITEGQTVRATKETYFEETGRPAPRLTLTLDSVEPRFYRDILLFTGLDSNLSAADGVTRKVGVGHPWWPDERTTVALTDFGWALEVGSSRVSDAPTSGLEAVPSPEATQTQVFNLKAFPPGSPDQFDYSLGQQGYRFRVRIYGDYVNRNGKPGSKSFNDSNPAAVVDAWITQTNGEAKQVLASKVASLPGSFELDGYEVRLGRLLHYGEYRVTRVPEAPVMLAGIVLALLGTMLRLVFYRVEAVLVPGETGTDIYVRADVYRDDPSAARALDRALRAAADVDDSLPEEQ